MKISLSQRKNQPLPTPPHKGGSKPHNRITAQPYNRITAQPYNRTTV